MARRCGQVAHRTTGNSRTSWTLDRGEQPIRVSLIIPNWKHPPGGNLCGMQRLVVADRSLLSGRAEECACADAWHPRSRSSVMIAPCGRICQPVHGRYDPTEAGGRDRRGFLWQLGKAPAAMCILLQHRAQSRHVRSAAPQQLHSPRRQIVHGSQLRGLQKIGRLCLLGRGANGGSPNHVPVDGALAGVPFALLSAVSCLVGTGITVSVSFFGSGRASALNCAALVHHELPRHRYTEDVADGVGLAVPSRPSR